MSSKEHETSTIRCVNCKEELDRAWGYDAEPPSPGDISICMDCHHIMIFGDNLKLRNPTDEEMIEIAGHPDLLSMMDTLDEYREWRKNI